MIPTLAAVTMFQQDMVDKMSKVEKMMTENKMLDRKLVVIIKKKEENLIKISGLVKEAKKMRVEHYEAGSEVIEESEDISRDNTNSPEENNETIETIRVEVTNGEAPGIVGDQTRDNEEVDYVGVVELKKEEKMLLQKIKESTKNLDDHKQLLETMEKEKGRDDDWKQLFSNVERYTIIHQKYKEAKEREISAIRKELSRIELKKKVVREKFVINQGASTSDDKGPGQPNSSFAVKRKLNESVLDCGEIVKKISYKEKEAMVPKVLKVEEAPSDSPYQCSFTRCLRSFTCAASLASHLSKHYLTNQDKFDCPFPLCQFVSAQEQLIKHMRARHTKEQMFTCPLCGIKFHTMDAKVAHERKHGQEDVWGQCQNQACLRFYQLARGHCRFCVRN